MNSYRAKFQKMVKVQVIVYEKLNETDMNYNGTMVKVSLSTL